MKKRLKIVVLLLLATLFLDAQVYSPMLGNSNNWTFTPTLYDDIVCDISTEDSTYNSILYKKIIQDDTYFMGLIREDVLNKKVWYIEPGSENERIIYDFSLNEGDSIYLQFNEDAVDLILKDGWYFVDSIRLRTIIDVDRRVFYLDNPLNDDLDGFFYQRPFIKWIEGVGSDYHPIYFFSRAIPLGYSEMNYIGGGFLICGFMDGEHIYQDFFIEYMGLNCHLTVGVSDKVVEHSYTSFPNPATDKIIVRFDNSLSKTPIVIYNILGKKVKQVYVNGKEISIDISGLENGIYFISIPDKTSVSTNRFLKI